MSNIQTFNNSALGRCRVIGNQENPLFCLKDVCDVLEITTPTKVKDSIENEFGKGVYQTHPLETAGGIQQAIFITEPQLYFVLMRSDKPKARPFRQWVINEVLPSIRKTGTYSIQQEPPPFSSVSGECVEVKFNNHLFTIILSDKHGFYISAKDTEKGYSLFKGAVRKYLRTRKEFIYGVDYIKAGDESILSGYRFWQVFLTKNTAIRISKYIKKKNSMLFKNWLLNIDLSSPPPQKSSVDIEEIKALSYLIYKGINKDINKDKLLSQSIKTLANKLNNSLNNIK